MSKNKVHLTEFTQFCKENPEMRFWQALRYWWKSKHDPKCNFIVISEDYSDKLDYDKVKDTYEIQ